MIKLTAGRWFNSVTGSRHRIEITYLDKPHIAATQEANTQQLAAEFGILPELAAKALNLLFPWDFMP
jgi:hypothetical protein